MNCIVSVRIIVLVLLLVLIVLGAVWFFVAKNETHDLSFHPKFDNASLIAVKTTDNDSVRSVVRKIDALLRRKLFNDRSTCSTISHENYFQLTTHRALISTRVVTSTIHLRAARLAMLTLRHSIRVPRSTTTGTIEARLVFS
jgi:hypothetical protein